MNTNYLLPNELKPLGWILFTLGTFSGLLLLFKGYDYEPIKFKVLSLFNNSILGNDSMSYFKIIETGVANELATIAIITGGLIIALSKEKVEDEFISKLRADSFIWAMITNYIVLLIATIFIYEMRFFTVLVFNMFTPIIFFIIRFNFLKFKSNSDEE